MKLYVAGITVCGSLYVVENNIVRPWPALGRFNKFLGTTYAQFTQHKPGRGRDVVLSVIFTMLLGLVQHSGEDVIISDFLFISNKCS